MPDPLDHPALQSVVRAMGRAFAQKIRFTREGGSGPAADLQDVLGVPVLFLGISVPSDGWHAPNEKVEIDLLLKGAETSAYLWGDLAEHWRAASPKPPPDPVALRRTPRRTVRNNPLHRGSWKHP